MFGLNIASTILAMVSAVLLFIILVQNFDINGWPWPVSWFVENGEGYKEQIRNFGDVEERYKDEIVELDTEINVCNGNVTTLNFVIEQQKANMDLVVAESDARMQEANRRIAALRGAFESSEERVTALLNIENIPDELVCAKSLEIILDAQPLAYMPEFKVQIALSQ